MDIVCARGGRGNEDANGLGIIHFPQSIPFFLWPPLKIPWKVEVLQGKLQHTLRKQHETTGNLHNEELHETCTQDMGVSKLQIMLIK